MRLIFEQHEDTDYFEVILTDKELQDLNGGLGAMAFCSGGLWERKDLNIFIRKENIGEITCLS
jgi:hypothetical protein